MLIVTGGGNFAIIRIDDCSLKGQPRIFLIALRNTDVVSEPLPLVREVTVGKFIAPVVFCNSGKSILVGMTDARYVYIVKFLRSILRTVD